LLVSVITPLADDYEIYDKGKAILESAADNGYVLIRLATTRAWAVNFRPIFRPRSICSRKKRRHAVGIDQTHPAGLRRNNRQRRTRLTALLGEMLAAAEYFVAGQPLKLKSSTPWARWTRRWNTSSKTRSAR